MLRKEAAAAAVEQQADSLAQTASVFKLAGAHG